MHKSLNEFEFLPDPTTYFRVICPWVRKKINILSCCHSSALIFYRIFYILAGNKDNQQVWTEFKFGSDGTKGCRVTTLDRCQKLVIAQYLENGWTEFNQIWYIHYHWQDLSYYCKASFFTYLQQSYSPWLMSEIGFAQILENEWTEFNQILYTLYHWLDLCYYCKVSFFANLQELRSLIDVRNWCLLNILRMDGQNLTKFCVHFTLTRSTCMLLL